MWKQAGSKDDPCFTPCNVLSTFSSQWEPNITREIKNQLDILEEPCGDACASLFGYTAHARVINAYVLENDNTTRNMLCKIISPFVVFSAHRNIKNHLIKF